MLENLLQGFALLANTWTIAAAATGLTVGIIIGAIPGLTTTMGVAILVPFTFFIPPTIGIPFLLGVYKGGIFGGSITAITIATPGTAAAAATVLDGYALASRGQARKALQASLYAVVFGDLFATMVLIAAAGPLAAMALKFSSPDFTMLLAFSLTMVAAVSGRSLLKGLFAAALGILIGCVGLDPMAGSARFTFGSTELEGGISLIPMLIGLFAISEILIQAEARLPRIAAVGVDGREESLPPREFFRMWPTLLRSSSIGAFLGALPGLGAEIACWISYGVAKRFSKKPQEYGKGSLEGVAAAESAANAVCPAALIPMLVFAIPGDTVTAVLIGAFMAHGLNPGPLLFEKHGEIIYGLFAVLIVSNLLLLLIGRVAIRWLRNVAAVPNEVLMPIVAALCFAGAYAINSSTFDVMVALVAGIVGYAMRKIDLPVPPVVIALLLAPTLEQNLRQSLAFSDGSLAIFVTRPIALTFLTLTLVSVAAIVYRSLRPAHARV